MNRCDFNPLDYDYSGMNVGAFICPKCGGVLVPDRPHPDYESGESFAFISGSALLLTGEQVKAMSDAREDGR